MFKNNKVATGFAKLNVSNIKSGENVLVTGNMCKPDGGARLFMMDLALRSIARGVKVYMIGTSREFRSYSKLMGGKIIDVEVGNIMPFEDRFVASSTQESKHPLTSINYSFTKGWWSSFRKYGLTIMNLERLLWKHWLTFVVPSLDEGSEYMVIIDDEFSREVFEYVSVYIEDLNLSRNLTLVVKFRDHEYLRKKCFLKEPFDWYVTGKELRKYEEMGVINCIGSEGQMLGEKNFTRDIRL
ncbi:MAG: hypothetical protein GY694_00445 [Gammaproteobacteria bacterium]|nr:hypothetical protein [Gammaproteobacteria bacterium]